MRRQERGGGRDKCWSYSTEKGGPLLIASLKAPSHLGVEKAPFFCNTEAQKWAASRKNTRRAYSVYFFFLSLASLADESGPAAMQHGNKAATHGANGGACACAWAAAVPGALRGPPRC